MWNRNISSFVKVGFGAVAHWGGDDIYVLTQYGLLTGAKTHHLEIGLGLNYKITLTKPKRQAKTVHCTFNCALIENIVDIVVHFVSL